MKTKMLSEINTILTNITRAVGADRSTVFLVNYNDFTLDSLISQGIRNNLISMPLDSGIAGRCASQGKPQIVNEVSENRYFNAYFDELTGYHTRKVLCVPIWNDAQQVVGVIQSLNKLKGDFNAQDLNILQSFADAVALAIKNAELYASAEAIRNDIATLLRVSASINSELDLSSLIRMIITKASEITRSDRSSFFLLDKEEDVLWTKYGEGLGAHIIKTRKGLAYRVAKSKQPHIENDPYNNPLFDQSIDREMDYTTHCIISIPVFNTTKEVIGVIQSMNKKDGAFTTQDLFILNGFASQISIAIQNSTLFEEISTIKNYLDTLFENLDNGILTIDKEGRVKTVNKRCCEILGVQTDELLGHHYRDLASQHYNFFGYSGRTLKSGEKCEKLNIETIDTHNRKLVLNYSALPMKNHEGENIGVINVIHDITSEERVKENLNRYLPQHVISEIIHKDDLSLFNGEHTRCSILFSDLRNFTNLTEKLGAIDVVNFLNHYFDVMVDYIFEHNGVLDKFIGDAIMATFGIPYNSEQDAANAVRASLKMNANLHRVNAQGLRVNSLNMGIGIASGEVISGNIGSTKRFEYTVIGDAVNLASRLEGLTKYYGVNMLICEDTYQAVADEFSWREIDRIKAKGKEKPVTIYTIANYSDQQQPDENQLALHSFYTQGLSLYRQKDFAAAEHAFRKALLFDETDQPSKVFLERCRQLRQSPPGEDWNGAWQFYEK
ncbi:GAF domain-containing protein [Haliscomenobacter hydrossis]|uniref:Adenylate/guanylate cyclase with TPR repeats n=1 Tax=Haliscomenobacter hydrossis (strain ATCC 27775 / DSM 1100 / LMG 10767 / O) TaxID=760192 RepID=F4L1M8_HALH1|nr:adenylate/guanylate cyclase domain-containing protein [Haliscomenobacter hydrossis]AEE48572.1 adenylate/guanylate cyclase with TPR repeats [Haliscomenobacter hydrossis DSM 1100]